MFEHDNCEALSIVMTEDKVFYVHDGVRWFAEVKFV